MVQGDMMTGAELKSDVEALGLTSQWLADRFGVRKRSVDYWMAGRNRVPHDVAQFVAAQEAKVQANIERAMLATAGCKNAHGVVCLVRYRTDADLWRNHPDMAWFPASHHAATISRVRSALWARNIPSMIVWMEDSVYSAWRGGELGSPDAHKCWLVYEALMNETRRAPGIGDSNDYR